MTKRKEVECNGCKAIYLFDVKDWTSFICIICNTFIHNKKGTK